MSTKMTQTFDLLSSNNLTEVSPRKKNFEFMKTLNEDSIKFMKKRIAELLNENVILKKQVSQESRGNRKLGGNLSVGNKSYVKEDINKNQQTRSSNASFSVPTNPRQEKKTNDMLWQFCKTCQTKFHQVNMNDPVILITKKKLDDLENNMLQLKALLNLKDKECNKIEQDKIYNQQFTRFAHELLTVNQLAENRYEDLQAMAEKLKEKEFELDNLQKKVSSMKRIIFKQEKRYRTVEKNNESKVVPIEMNERERRWIERIMQQPLSPRRKHKSKGN